MRFPYTEVYHRMGIGWGKRDPYYRKRMSTNFLGSHHTMGLAASSRAIGN